MAVTLKVADGKVDFVDTKLDQPVTGRDQQGQMQRVPGMLQDITVKYTMAKDEIQLELIQLGKRRTDVVAQHTATLAQIDERIQTLKDAEALIVASEGA